MRSPSRLVSLAAVAAIAFAACSGGSAAEPSTPASSGPSAAPSGEASVAPSAALEGTLTVYAGRPKQGDAPVLPMKLVRARG